MGAHYERARLLSIQRRYELAERELREDLAENPHNGQAHAFLGRCLAQQKRLKEALVECEEGVHLAPHLAYAHYMLGLTYDDCGRMEDAESAVREALRLEPRNIAQLQWLSWIQYRRGDRRAALDTVDQGLEIDPQHVDCLNSRGQYLRALGDWKDSEIAVRTALKLDPDNAFTHGNLGWTLWNKAHFLCGVRGWFRPWFVAWRKETREAHKHFLEALRLDPTSDWAKTGAADTLTARWDAIVQFTLALLIAAVAFLVWMAYSVEGRLVSGSDAPPAALGIVLILAGGLSIFFARGPIYAVVSRTRLGAAVLSPARRLAARATDLCLGAAIVAGLLALVTPPPTAAGALFVSLIVVRPLTVAIEADVGRVQRTMAAYALVLLVGGLILAACLGFTSGEHRVQVCIVLLVGGIIGSEFSERIARDLTNRLGKRTR